MSELIRVEGVHKSFHDGVRELLVLKGIDLEIEAGEIIAIMGASGVGKSTLLHILGALDRPTSGRVLYDGQDIFTMSDDELAHFRNQQIGFVFQFHHLLPEFSALENVAMGALIAREERRVALERASELLDQMGLGDRLHHKPSQLSGGERQRVAIARALINAPRVVLADEPTGNLDRKASEAIHDLLWELNARIGQTLIIVTHNQELARRAHRLIEMKDGRFVTTQD